MPIYFYRIVTAFIFYFTGLSFSYSQEYQASINYADGQADFKYVPHPCTPLAVNPFSGGNADGHADLQYIPHPCSVITVNPYGGGIADGHADLKYSPHPCSVVTVNPYGGGIADGHADLKYSPHPCTVVTVNPYGGGIADGHADLKYSPHPCSVVTVNPYGGGIADGHADLKYSPHLCTVVTVNPYAGGIADGHADTRLNIDNACNLFPLPIELLLFNAQPNGKVVDVKWSTASEWNTNYYIVHRSKDGVNYEEVTRVQAAGNSSSIKNYLAVDKEPFMGTSYYNLQQTDMNGQYRYYGPVSVQFNQSDGIFIYPNPANGKFNIQLVNGQSLAGNSQIEIYNVLGEKVYSSNLQLNNFIIDLTSQPNGVYIVQIKTEKETISEKVVISK